MRFWVVNLCFRSGTVKRSKVTKAENVIKAEYNYRRLFPEEFTSKDMYANAVPCDDYLASQVLKMKQF